LGQRSRKRGRREPPPRRSATRVTARKPDLDAAAMSRSQLRDAAAREALSPLPPGERPWSIKVSVLLTAVLGAVNLFLFIIGAKPKVSGQQPKLPEILVFSGLMLMCSIGMWRLRYWAVLGFQTLLAIGLLGFSLALVRVNSIFWAILCVLIIGSGGYLFWKLVRVLSRIQMPEPPRR
jgi:hypothetical protein